MIGYKLPETVLSRLSTLKQQELDIKEIIATIFENINQRRADLRFCLPELREVLIGLLQDHSIDARDLERTLGESHPVTILCGQREDQLIEAANDAIHMAGSIVRDEEDRFMHTMSYDDGAKAMTDVYNEPEQDTRQTVTESEQITRSSMIEADNVAVEDLSLQAEQATSKDTLQVRVNMHQTLDTAHCLPLGPAREAQSTTGIRQLLPPSLPLEHRGSPGEGDHQPEEQETRRGCSKAEEQQVTHLVHELWKDELEVTTSACDEDQLGGTTMMEITSELDTRQLTNVSELDTRLPNIEDENMAEENLSLLAVQAVVPSTSCGAQSAQHCATQSISDHTTIDVISQQTSKPSQILDRCLAQASAASITLDRLSASQASGRTETVIARDPPINQGLLNPRAQLDIILARASQLLGKLDKVSARVSGTIESDQQRGQDSSRQISDKEAAAWEPRMVAVPPIASPPASKLVPVPTMAEKVNQTTTPSVCQSKMVAVSTMADYVKQRQACQLKMVAVSTTEGTANLKVKIEKNHPLDTAVHPPLATRQQALQAMAANSLQAQAMSEDTAVSAVLRNMEHTGLPIMEEAIMPRTEDPVDMQGTRQPMMKGCVTTQATADTTQPKTQVQVSIVKTKDAAAHSPLGTTDRMIDQEIGQGSSKHSTEAPCNLLTPSPEFIVAENDCQNSAKVRVFSIAEEEWQNSAKTAGSSVAEDEWQNSAKSAVFGVVEDEWRNSAESAVFSVAEDDCQNSAKVTESTKLGAVTSATTRAKQSKSRMSLLAASFIVPAMMISLILARATKQEIGRSAGPAAWPWDASNTLSTVMVPMSKHKGKQTIGSDTDPADPEYLPKDYDKESRLASDSSDDEAVLTLVLSASRPCWESLENVGLCTLVSW